MKIEKAITAAATVDQVKPDEATVNGENKPSIQEAKTVEEVAKTPVVEAAPPTPIEVTSPVPKSELSFDGIFANDFSLGSTLRPNPNGGNMIHNIKKPAFDYVEQAKNKRNMTLTPEEFAKQAQPKK